MAHSPYPGGPGRWPPAPAPRAGRPPDAATLWGYRLGAWALDSLILLVPFVLVWLFTFAIGFAAALRSFSGSGEAPGFGAGFLIGLATYLVQLLLFGLVTAGYYIPLEGGARGQTVGKRAAAVRVVDARSGAVLGYGQATVRWAVRLAIWSTLWLPFPLSLASPLILVDHLWPLWDDRTQALHDKLARTLVVRTRAEPAYPSPFPSAPPYGPPSPWTGWGAPPSSG